ncbi:MAG TPA: hypothetical protein VH684_26165 [Xanthobacteraceae bacterium]|jgi:hypothetical protein
MRLDDDNSIVPLEDADPREEILRLEDEIESLAALIERCRKIDLAARLAVAGGALVLLGLAFGILFNELILVCAITAAIGGIVAYGSNLSTSRQAASELKAAEARRAELIDASNLRLVE